MSISNQDISEALDFFFVDKVIKKDISERYETLSDDENVYITENTIEPTKYAVIVSNPDIESYDVNKEKERLIKILTNTPNSEHFKINPLYELTAGKYSLVDQTNKPVTITYKELMKNYYDFRKNVRYNRTKISNFLEAHSLAAMVVGEVREKYANKDESDINQTDNMPATKYVFKDHIIKSNKEQMSENKRVKNVIYVPPQNKEKLISKLKNREQFSVAEFFKEKITFSFVTKAIKQALNIVINALIKIGESIILPLATAAYGVFVEIMGWFGLGSIFDLFTSIKNLFVAILDCLSSFADGFKRLFRSVVNDGNNVLGTFYRDIMKYWDQGDYNPNNPFDVLSFILFIITNATGEIISNIWDDIKRSYEGDNQMIGRVLTGTMDIITNPILIFMFVVGGYAAVKFIINNWFEYSIDYMHDIRKSNQ